MNNPLDIQASVRIIASKDTWMDGKAVRQLHETSKLPGMRLAVGLPDLHPGRGIPVGAAFVSDGIFYPHLVGNDVGCGMGLWKTDLRRKKVKLDQLLKRIPDLENPWEDDASGWLSENGLEPSEYDQALGTLGGGNHFAELQVVEEVQDEEAFRNLGLSLDCLTLLVHSGSRRLGEAVWTRYVGNHGTRGITDGSGEALSYLSDHSRGVHWARTNRALIAHRFLSGLRAEGQRVLDLAHNTITAEQDRKWLHRKGAAPSDQGAVIIPGSRGTLSYLAVPVGNQESNARSLAHGAGRKWNRNQCRERLSARYSPESLLRTNLGGRVICEDRDLLYQEVPQAYKKIDTVVRDLVEEELIRVIAVFRPLITYKTRRAL